MSELSHETNLALLKMLPHPKKLVTDYFLCLENPSYLHVLLSHTFCSIIPGKTNYSPSSLNYKNLDKRLLSEALFILKQCEI